MQLCELCTNNIDQHPAIYAEILQLEKTGHVPEGTYDTIVYNICNKSGCERC